MIGFCTIPTFTTPMTSFDNSSDSRKTGRELSRSMPTGPLVRLCFFVLGVAGFLCPRKTTFYILRSTVIGASKELQNFKSAEDLQDLFKFIASTKW